jgi:carbamoyl-phosphate synthase large subunit
MTPKITIFFSSAGRRVELIKCFREDALSLGVDLYVIAGDLKPRLSAACQVADESIEFPACMDPRFGSSLVNLCRDKNVSLLVPTIDTELSIIAEKANELRSLGVLPVVSSPEIVGIARSKSLTVNKLSEFHIATPDTLPLIALEEAIDRLGFPLIAKPVGGSNSVGIVKIRGLQDLRNLPNNRENYIIQKMIVGREFTVNFLMNYKSEIQSIVPHERLEVRGGEVSKGRTTRLPQLEELIPKLQSALFGGFGPMCFQAILTPSDEFVIFEINARFGGGYPLTHRAGARFSKWLLEAAMGRIPSPIEPREQALTMLRYDSAIFI